MPTTKSRTRARSSPKPVRSPANTGGVRRSTRLAAASPGSGRPLEGGGILSNIAKSFVDHAMLGKKRAKTAELPRALAPRPLPPRSPLPSWPPLRDLTQAQINGGLAHTELDQLRLRNITKMLGGLRAHSEGAARTLRDCMSKYAAIQVTAGMLRAANYDCSLFRVAVRPNFRWQGRRIIPSGKLDVTISQSTVHFGAIPVYLPVLEITEADEVWFGCGDYGKGDVIPTPPKPPPASELLAAAKAIEESRDSKSDEAKNQLLLQPPQPTLPDNIGCAVLVQKGTELTSIHTGVARLQVAWYEYIKDFVAGSFNDWYARGYVMTNKGAYGVPFLTSDEYFLAKAIADKLTMHQLACGVQDTPLTKGHLRDLDADTLSLTHQEFFD